MKKLARNISDIVDLFFPKLCITCGERLVSQENYLCMNCWHDLPVTNFHKNSENKVTQLFWGRVNIENATSFFGYKKGSRYRELIHYIKYKGLKELGLETGKRFGFVLAQTDEFNTVDLIVPVPLHKRKLKKRGFNQSDWIAAGVAEVLKKPVSTDNLFRRVYTATQTKKNRFERFRNVEGIFAIKEQHKFEGKHILLIDDVVTTGSTLEACAVEILKLDGTKVSIATLAFADY
jgi:ComF family protein